jgi:hypothetical protein
VRHQAAALDHLALHHRDHGHESAEAGAGDLEENPEQGRERYARRGQSVAGIGIHWSVGTAKVVF